MSKYECIVCGYIYDPEVGDPDGSILPGTPFEKLPDTWVCPVCGAAKSEFKKLCSRLFILKYALYNIARSTFNT